MEADSPNEALVGLAQLLQSDDLHVQQQPQPELRYFILRFSTPTFLTFSGFLLSCR